MVDEFKAFALKGNVLDLAVGVIIGGAFGKIVSGLVDNILMPLVSVVMPNPEWKTAFFPLKEIKNDKGEIVMAKLTYGAFFGSIVDFLIVAIVIFMIVKAANKAMPKKEEAPAGPPPQEKLLAEIRDLLAKK
jgi:large conductance mechanosensitive channel